MKIYALHFDAYNWRPGVSYVDTMRFHGEGLLKYGTFGMPENDLYDPKPVSMKIVHTNDSIPDVFIPMRSSNLVISERVREDLESTELKFLEATVYRESTLQNGEREKVDGRYYEILSPNHYRLAEKLGATHTFYKGRLDIEQLEFDLVPVSILIFEQHPVTDTGIPLIRDDVFDILEKYIVRSMFGIKSFDFTTGCTAIE